MFQIPEFKSVDAAFSALIDYVQGGEAVSPRGQNTIERQGISFRLMNPRARVVSNSGRKFYLPLALAETIWNFQGRQDVDYLARYAPVWRTFSDDGYAVRGSCYGKNAFSGSKNSQWELCKQVLLNDRSSRRAVISLYPGAKQGNLRSRDISCTTALQFFIRNNRLDLITHMRSNDLFIGLPYDVFLFTVFQELMANELNMEIGIYTHIVNSMHIYHRDLERAKGSFANDSMVSADPPIISGNKEEFVDRILSGENEGFEAAASRVMSSFDVEESGGRRLSWSAAMKIWRGYVGIRSDQSQTASSERC